MTRMMFRAVFAFALFLPVATQDALADSKTQRPKVTVRKQAWKGYGFLPGYRTERERQRDRAYEDRRYIGWDGRTYYGYGWPGFYGGRYNGGSFGPCWTSTPIGMMWNCGR